MDVAKEEFLREFGRDYGYPGGPKTIDEIRATEFKRLSGKISIQFWESDRSGHAMLLKLSISFNLRHPFCSI